MAEVTVLAHSRIYTGGSSPVFFPDGAVAWNGDTVRAVGDTPQVLAQFPDAHVLEGKNRLVLPGFICGHAHFYGMFSRGMALKDPPPADFLQVLERLWWRLDRALEDEDTYLSAMVCLIQAIKCGTTTIFDHHASPNAITGSLDVIARATKEVGVRACLAYEVTDRNGKEGAALGVAENVRFLRRCFENAPDPLLSASFGLHASFTISDETLRMSVEGLKSVQGAAGKAGFHIHVAEGPQDEEDSMTRCAKRTVHRLKDAGILTPNTICGHCVFVDDDERHILKDAGVFVVHNPSSNMNNGVGVADALGLMKKDGICVGLGTDGVTFDMIQETKMNYFVHKLHRHDPRVMGSETLEMLFAHNARLASAYFAQSVGVLAPGSFADLVLLDYDPPTELTAGNLPWHMVFGMSQGMVNSTICAGKFLMQERQLQTVDEAAIMRRARERAVGVWERF